MAERGANFMIQYKIMHLHTTANTSIMIINNDSTFFYRHSQGQSLTYLVHVYSQNKWETLVWLKSGAPKTKNVVLLFFCGPNLLRCKYTQSDLDSSVELDLNTVNDLP